MVMLSPFAAPSIIRPMIEVPHTFEPSFLDLDLRAGWRRA
jgi:hypothetical protein